MRKKNKTTEYTNCDKASFPRFLQIMQCIKKSNKNPFPSNFIRERTEKPLLQREKKNAGRIFAIPGISEPNSDTRLNVEYSRFFFQL